MRKTTIALTGTFAALATGLAILARKPTPALPEALLATVAEAPAAGDVNLVSWLRPGPWRFQRCHVSNYYRPLIWVPQGSVVQPGTPVKVILAEGPRRGAKNAMWIVAATTTLERPLDLTHLGMPGCHLELPLENVTLLLPGAGTVGACKRVEGVVDTVEFTWTPTADHVGRRLFLQGIVAAPGENTAGLLVTDAVELLVGSGA